MSVANDFPVPIQPHEPHETNRMNRTQVLGLIRHILTFGGGLLVAKGVIDEGLATELVGAVITLIGGIWSAAAPEKR